MGGGGKGKGYEKDKRNSKAGDHEVYSRDTLLQANPRFGPAAKEPIVHPDGYLHCRPREELPEMMEAARPRAASDSAHPTVRNKPTTVMLKNIPVEYTRTGVCEELAAAGFGYAIDFLYMPVDSATGFSLGHAFINVRTKEALRDFTKVFDGVSAKSCFPRQGDHKENRDCVICTAETQGRDANMKKLCTVANLNKWTAHDEWQPLFLDDYGQKIPMSHWQGTIGDGRRERSASQQGSPLIVPQASPVLKPWKEPTQTKASPSLRAEAKVFSPSSPVLRAEAKVFSPAISAEATRCSPSLRAEAETFVPSLGMLPDAAVCD